MIEPGAERVIKLPGDLDYPIVAITDLHGQRLELERLIGKLEKLPEWPACAKSARRIHRLVLEAFVGPCLPGMVACHNDGNRWNSDLANLRWDTPKANSDDTLRHGTRATGSRCGATKLSEVEVIEIRRSRARACRSKTWPLASM